MSEEGKKKKERNPQLVLNLHIMMAKTLYGTVLSGRTLQHDSVTSWQQERDTHSKTNLSVVIYPPESRTKKNGKEKQKKKKPFLHMNT